MTLTTIKNDIQAFGKKKIEYMRGYIAMQDDFQDKLHKQLIGKVYAEETLLKYKKDAENYFSNTFQMLCQQLEKEKNIELENLKSKEESITADDVADLSLFSSIKPTAVEMKGFCCKVLNLLSNKVE